MAALFSTEPKRTLAATAVLAAAALVVYTNTLRVPFLFDDVLSTAGNPTLHRWSTALFPPRGQGLTVEGRPMLNLSFAVNQHLSGDGVWSYHLGNLLIHILAGLALFGIVRRTLGRASALADANPGPREGEKWSDGGPSARFPRSTGLAFAVALLWIVHPLQTESVTYIAQRAESLMGLFYLVTIYCFVQSAEDGSSCGGVAADKESGGRTWAWLSVLACLLGMATKEVMVSAPLTVWLLDRALYAGSFRRAWSLRRKYYAALAATWLLLAALVFAAGSRGGTSGVGSGVSVLRYWATQPAAILRYVRLAFWPRPLVFDYGTQWFDRPAQVIFPLIVVALLGALSVWALRRNRPVGVLGFWFFAVLATTSLVPGNRQTAAEHRMYLPLAAVLIVVIATAHRLISLRGSRWLVVLGVFALPLAAVTVGRNRDYASESMLYQDTVAKVPDNGFARYNLGKLLDEAGRPAEAIFQYQAALRIDPTMARADINLGNSYGRLRRFAEAEAAYRSALELNPRSAPAHYELGLLLLQTGRHPEALKQFGSAVTLDPSDADARDNLGGLLLESGRLEEAREQFEIVLRHKRASVETYYNLGMVCLLQHRTDEAREQFEAALRLDSRFAPARERLRQLGPASLLKSVP